MLQKRSERVRPRRDEKAILSWNAMFIHSLCLAHQVLDEENYLRAAEKCAKVLLERLSPIPETMGLMRHSFKDKKTQGSAYIDDYAFLINALVSLYESTFEKRWIDEAVTLAKKVIEQFWSPDCFFYFTAKDQETLISRPIEKFDGATPSGHGMAVFALLKLGKLTLNQEFLGLAESALKSSAAVMGQVPQGSAQLIQALYHLIDAPKEFVIGCDGAPPKEMLSAIRERFLPNKVVAVSGKDSVPLGSGKGPVDGRAAMYVCEGFSCLAPVTRVEDAKF